MGKTIDAETFLSWLNEAEEELKNTIADELNPDRKDEGILLTTETVRKYVEKMCKIDEAEGKADQKWISCSERLPKKPERGENGYIVQKKRVAEPFSAYWDGERWTNEDGDVVDEVMAWLPLPKPYKEKKDGN